MEWIKSSEKLPELSQRVIAFAKDTFSLNKNCYIAIFISKYDGGWWYDEEHNSATTSKVMSHWLPLLENSKGNKFMEWIKSSERLPPDGEIVLIFMPKLIYKHDFAIYNSEWDEWKVGLFAPHSMRINYWLPLPENPKE